MNKDSRILVLGHRGLVGSSMIESLKDYKNVFVDKYRLNLINTWNVWKLFTRFKPEYVFLCAAKVGGIKANIEKPAEFIWNNLMIEGNVIGLCHALKIKKLLFLGSSCIYPRNCPQPMKEEYLLTGLPEPTNEYYAIAKIAGIKMCQAFNKQYGTNFISVMPTNLYGENDHFQDENAHIIPSLISRFADSMRTNKDMVIWGSGTAKREFMYVHDMTDACVYLMENYNKSEFVNIGTGEEVSIKKLVEILVEIFGYKGKIVWDKTKPDGMPRKLLDLTKLHKLGWKHKTSLREGLEKTIKYYLKKENR